VYVVELIRIFQIDLQDVYLGSITVHGIDVEILRKSRSFPRGGVPIRHSRTNYWRRGRCCLHL